MGSCPQKGVKLVSRKWVYKVKRRIDALNEMYKALVVTHGFSQQYGTNYEDMFSHVAKMTTIRVLVSLAASES